jgi:predicted ATP-grasp superfamily ATP-dependent carboligase
MNPRPGATLDIFDDIRGNLFRAHVEAGLGNELWQERDLPAAQSRASAILYADQGSLTAGEINWPDWTADRPAPGTAVPVEQPIATVFAEGATADEAERVARDRLSTLLSLVYTASEKS